MTALRWRCVGCERPLDGPELPCPACGRALQRAATRWICDPAFRPPGFPAERRDHLAAIEGDHFWFAPRQRLVGKLIDTWFPPPIGAALELGCGSGRFLPELVRRALLVAGVEAWPESLTAAAVAAPTATLIQGSVTSIPFADGQFDLVVALDVLEHEDPVRLLAETARVLRPDGALLLSVPAFQSLWSEHDAAAGHRVRHTRATLTAELATNGWRLECSTHYQFLLFPLVWTIRHLPGARWRRGERQPSALVNRLLGAIDALEVRCLSRYSLPFGSSLIVLARRG